VLAQNAQAIDESGVLCLDPITKVNKKSRKL